MEIGGLQKSTLIDYPGHIACTLFLVGCNFRCPWCYSPEIVLPDMITKQSKISRADFLGFLERRKGLLDGVVICGGEPTINEDLPGLLAEIKGMGFKAKLDTNGSNPSVIKNLIDGGLIDYVAMDIKAPFKKVEYERAVGVGMDPEKLIESAGIIKESGIDYEFRTTVVPLFHGKKEIREMAEAISPAKKYFLQTFRPEKNIDPALSQVAPYPEKFMEELKKEIEHLFEACEVR